MARINEQVLQALTTVETSAVYKYRKRKGHDIVKYTLTAGTMAGSGGGALTGVYSLETSVPGMDSWNTVTSGTFTNTETSGTFVPGGNIDIRWNCTTAGDDVVVSIG